MPHAGERDAFFERKRKAATANVLSEYHQCNMALANAVAQWLTMAMWPMRILLYMECADNMADPVNASVSFFC